MNLNAAGSLDDLTALEDGVAGGGGGGGGGCEPGTMGMSAQALKRLENLKIDKLKQIRRPTPPNRCTSNKLPAIPGKYWDGIKTINAQIRGFLTRCLV